MNVLPLFIDDWLSSPRIEAMDAAEERGYMRLLMRAAKNDGWIANDPVELALWSKLGRQWNKVTHDPKYRVRGVTSGQKILECFVERGDRLYNQRLEIAIFSFKNLQEQRRKAAQKRWRTDSASNTNNSNEINNPVMREHMRPDMQTHMQTGMQTACENDASHTHTHTHTQEAVSTLVVSPVPVAERIFENRENHTQALPAIVDAPATEAQAVSAPRATLVDFERWWGGWSAVRGTNHRKQAFTAWLTCVKPNHLPDVFLCTASYLGSLENPAKGYNPENFLTDQAADSFKARWPPKRGSPGDERRREAARKFQERMREEMGNGQRKIQSA